jgi:histidinol dehydrogenase
VTPIERVGIYVPGGTASYPSTVLMNAIPAKTAGVPFLSMVTPPGRDGEIPDAILAAADIAEVDIIYKCGGAQSIAALAYGTETIRRVYKITGPGNIYVAAAKRQVFGIVDIDMTAGPSDILIIADRAAKPCLAAADMLAQAEHDKLAKAILVTPSRELAAEVQAELYRQLEKLPRKEIARASIETGGAIIIVSDLAQAAECANRAAPEHLELCVGDPWALLEKITNAGSVFLGQNTPEALGDYFAGPNHTLPTMGTARFNSPLSVDDFVKRSGYTYYTREALSRVSDKIAAFARLEGLDAHALSALARFETEGGRCL